LFKSDIDAAKAYDFYILKTDHRLVFGGATNVGFLESGYMEYDDSFSLDETLQELVADLETYYNDGPDYVSHIVFNKRM
jgi:hypothetical protein